MAECVGMMADGEIGLVEITFVTVIQNIGSVVADKGIVQTRAGHVLFNASDNVIC